MTKEEVLSGILGDACHKFFDEDSLQDVLTAMDEWYNQALDDSLEVVRKRWGSALIIEDIQALKKKP